MFKIREFSRFTRVSVKMLRHYDDIGLLKPARVDDATGYRFYATDQLPRLNRIIALKDLGFGLDQIGNLLDDNLSVDEMRGMLRLRRAQIEQQLQKEQTRLAQVEARLAHIEHGETKAKRLYDVIVRDVPAQWFATLRQVVPDANDIAALFDEAEDYVGQFRARDAACPMTLFHDEEYKDDWADVEVAVPVARQIPSTERIQVKEMAHQPAMACVVYTGTYDQLVDALNAILIWVDKNNHSVCGPLREVYLRYSANPHLDVPSAFLTQRREEWVTELQVPVK